MILVCRKKIVSHMWLKMLNTVKMSSKAIKINVRLEILKIHMQSHVPIVLEENHFDSFISFLT